MSTPTEAAIARDNAVFYSDQATAAFTADPPDPELGLYLAGASAWWTRAASTALAAALSPVAWRPEAGERADDGKSISERECQQ